MKTSNIKRSDIFNIKIHQITKNQAEKKILEWAEKHRSKYVCFCNSHTVYLANKDKNIKEVINKADLSLADGVPLAWGMRLQGIAGVQRIAGPDMMHNLCRKAERKGLRVFLYGADNFTLNLLTKKLSMLYNKLIIAGSFSPPFRKLKVEEEKQYENLIKKAQPNLVFVGLGFPKQEIWMAKAKNNIDAVLLGVGAAFDFIAGTKRRSPRWMQSIGMEWFWRMLHEPKRLGKRYLLANGYLVIKTIENLYKKLY